MKYVQNLTMLAAVIAFSSCESNKRSTITESGDEIVKARMPKEDTLDKEVDPQMRTLAVTGVVTDVSLGKDGYTARVEAGDGEVYFVTMSRANLKDPGKYHASKPGDTISVSGDVWKLHGKTQLTVREIK